MKQIINMSGNFKILAYCYLIQKQYYKIVYEFLSPNDRGKCFVIYFWL